MTEALQKAVRQVRILLEMDAPFVSSNPHEHELQRARVAHALSELERFETNRDQQTTGATDASLNETSQHQQ